MPKIKYTGPSLDYSGVGSAARSFVCALDSVGVEVTAEVISYDTNRENFFGSDYETIRKIQGRDLRYDIKIIHVPGDSYLQHLEPCKYHIGRLAWETSRLPPESVWNLNLLDEIWTGSKHNMEVFQKSGVHRPIYIFPETTDMTIYDKELPNWEIDGFNGFMFFDVFQFIERKNPEVLVKAYLEEFTAEDNVGLLLKTYREKMTITEKQDISVQLIQWKSQLKEKSFPPIFLSVELMDKDDVFRIYKTGDCFVAPHAGEGWGRCIVEALIYGKPVIATNLGGVHDHITKECYVPLSHKEENVKNMAHFVPLYREDGTQKWGKVSKKELKQKMRWVYNNQKEAKEIGKIGQDFVKQNFSYEAVGRAMKDRLSAIQDRISEERKAGIKWLNY